MKVKLSVRALLATATLAGALSAGGLVQAQESGNELTWSYATASVGNCTHSVGNATCGPRRVVRQETFYGANEDNSASVRPEDYKPATQIQHFGSAFAWAEVGDDPLGLPSLHALVDSRVVPGFPGSGLTFVGINTATAIGVQGFTNTSGGQLVIPLSSLEGEIHYRMGSPNPGSMGSVGASLAFTTDAILNPDVAQQWLTPASTLGGFATGCSTLGALAFGQTRTVNRTGVVEERSSVGVSGCGGATELVLDQGESFYIWARLGVGRGGQGFVDAGNTFNIQFTQEARTSGLDLLLATQLAVAEPVLNFVLPEPEGVVVGGVPEPATWAMMILGFGAAGAAMRRRRLAPA